MKKNIVYSFFVRAAAIITILALTACSGVSAVQVGTNTSAPVKITTIPTTTLTIPAALATALTAFTEAPPTTPTITPTAAPTIQTYTNKPDDNTQALLRVSNCVYHGPSLDVWINGKAVMNGGIPMPKLPPFGFGGYVYLQPGDYQVAVAPDGAGLDKTFAGQQDVPLSAGHRYTAVVMGQADEASHNLLLIDETAAFQALGDSPSTSRYRILINNLQGAPAITYSESGQARITDAPFNNFKAGILPVGLYTGWEYKASDAQGTIPDHSFDDSYHTSGIDDMVCIGGKIPGSMDVDFNHLGSQANFNSTLTDYLNAQTKVGSDQTYNTFTNFINISGLADELNNGGPYLIFAPRDDAILMTKAVTDAISNKDTKFAADFVKSYVVKGYYPMGSLIGPSESGRTLINLLGKELIIDGESLVRDGFMNMTINGRDVGADNDVMLPGGTRVRTLDLAVMTQS